MRILPKWANEGFLGTRDKSKAVTPTHFEETRERPLRAYAVLRVWSICRARQGTFLSGKSGRLSVFKRELETLKDELGAMGHGGLSGNLAADALIRKWAPDALP